MEIVGLLGYFCLVPYCKIMNRCFHFIDLRAPDFVDNTVVEQHFKR